MEIRRVSVNSNGTIRAIINFSLRTFCDDSDFKNFPNDMYRCCYQIEPHINQVQFNSKKKRTFKLKSSQSMLDAFDDVISVN